MIHLIIENYEDLDIEFTQCKVQNVTFRSQNQTTSKKLKLKFVNCDLRQLKIIKSDIEDIELKECFFDPIDFTGTIVRNLTFNDSICRDKKTKYITDTKTEIRKEYTKP